jgi:hypothetical protein
MRRYYYTLSAMVLALNLAPGIARATSPEVKAARLALKEAQKKDKATRAKDKLSKAEERVKTAEERLQDAKDRLSELQAEAKVIAAAKQN